MATSNGASQERVMTFTPQENYDASVIEPDAAVGEYTAKITAMRVQPTKTDGAPMLIVDFKLVKAADSDNETSEGATLSEFIVFKAGAGGKFGKQKIQAISKALDTDLDLIPTSIRTDKDFGDLIAAWKGQQMTVWVTHSLDKTTNETRCNLAYTAPRSGGLSTTSDDDRPAAKPAKKKSR
jgi:hypothetical protein